MIRQATRALSPPSRFGSPGFSSTVMGLGGGSSLNKRRRRVIAQRRLLAVIPLQMPPKRRARCAFLLTMVEMGASRDIAFLCLPRPRPPAAPPPRARAAREDDAPVEAEVTKSFRSVVRATAPPTASEGRQVYQVLIIYTEAISCECPLLMRRGFCPSNAVIHE